ncbi:hypothetical protein pkur_cds_750 [Pandoravirus kuranda]|uniref:Uncharacterized protein n=1 Tax=Pandoravirus kuranda TaxID=3019033 RepID=A0AA95J2G8_9VIRU|nr:hypothetical protein pkur_cds_750 [Pandoravirus kuranda]
MERTTSLDLLDRIRDELGPWRGHSAVKRVVVTDDDQAADGVRIVFEVSAWAAARCQLPSAMWIGALGGRRVPIEHTAIQDDPLCTSVRVIEQRRRSGSHSSPMSPVASTSSASPSTSRSSSTSSTASSPSSSVCSSPALSPLMASSPVWAADLPPGHLPAIVPEIKAEPTEQPDKVSCVLDPPCATTT